MTEILWPIDVIANDTCPVIRVVRPEAPGGFVIINEADLKPEDVLYKPIRKGD